MSNLEAINKKRADEREYLITEIEWMLSQGMTPWEVSEAVGRSIATLSRFLWRWGRKDLAGPFEVIDGEDRRKAGQK